MVRDPSLKMVDGGTILRGSPPSAQPSRFSHTGLGIGVASIASCNMRAKISVRGKTASPDVVAMMVIDRRGGSTVGAVF
jgi:hypothetical protein